MSQEEPSRGEPERGLSEPGLSERAGSGWTFGARGTAVAAGMVLVLVVGFLVQHGLDLRERRRLMNAMLIARQADLLRDSDPALAAQFDLAERRLAPGIRSDARVLADADQALSRLLTGSPGPVDVVSPSPDGLTVAGGGADGVVRLWTVATPGRPGALSAPLAVAPSAGPLLDLVWSPDGRSLVGTVGEDSLLWWDVSDRAHPHLLGEPETEVRTRSLAFGPDGRTLAAGGETGEILVWELTDRTRLVPLGEPLPGAGPVDSLAFSPNGRTLATAGAVPSPPFHDSDDGSSTSPEPTSGPVPDGGFVQVWDLTDRRHPTSLAPALAVGTGPTAEGDPQDCGCGAVGFSPDGQFLIGGGADGLLQVWDLGDRGSPRALGPGLTTGAPVTAMAFAPDGLALATAGENGAVQPWDLTDVRRPRPLGPPLAGHTGQVSALAFTASGDCLLSGGTDRTIRLWELTDHASPASRLSRSGARRTSTATVVPDGQVVLRSRGTPEGPWPSDRTEQPSIGPNSPIVQLGIDGGVVRKVAFGPGGRTAVAAVGSGIAVWDLTDRQRPRLLADLLPDHTGDIYAVDLSPDGRTLAAGVDHEVRLWDLTDPAHPVPLGTPLDSASVAVFAVTFSPDGRTLVSGGENNVLRWWSVADRSHPVPLGNPVPASASTHGPVQSVAFSPDGRTVATGTWDGTTRLWDLTVPTRPELIGERADGQGGITAVVFSADGRTLVTGEKHVVRLWDLTVPGRLVPRTTPLRYSENPQTELSAVAWSPDGRTLAVGGNDELIRLWDLTDLARPVPVGESLAGGGAVTAVEFAPDGRTLAGATGEGTVRWWNRDVPSAVDRICTATAGALTEDRWNHYLPGLPYSPGCPGTSDRVPPPPAAFSDPRGPGPA